MTWPRAGATLCAALALFLAGWGQALAWNPVIIDGQFDDWQGKVHLESGSGEATLRWYWDTDLRKETIVFMVEKSPDPSWTQVSYTVFVDTNNNGRFDDPGDVRIEADWVPSRDLTLRVGIFRGNRRIAVQSGQWGETGASGLWRSEWAVPLRLLGIEHGQVARMVLFAVPDRRQVHEETTAVYEQLVRNGSALRVPEGGDLQLALLPTLGPVLQVAVMLLGIGLASRIILRLRQGEPE